MTAASNKPQRGSGFYTRQLDDDDRKIFWQALDLEGIDEEVALLRTTLQMQFKSDMGTFDALLRNVDLLVRAVSAQYRMSPKSARDFAERLTATLRDLGEQIAPGLSGGGDDV
jgi:hypothetical protein